MNDVKKRVLPDEIFDLSSKLLKCQRERLKWMKETYDMTYKALGKYYNIAGSTAFYICNPGAAERKKMKWLKSAHEYYDSERAVISAAKSRKKTKSIYKQFNLPLK